MTMSMAELRRFDCATAVQKLPWILLLVTLAMFAAAVRGTMIGAGGGFVLIPGLVLLFGLKGLRP